MLYVSYMFKVKNHPREISVKKFVRSVLSSVLSNNYKWKCTQAKLLVRVLLANKFVLETVKQELELNWKFVGEDIDNLTLVCKDSNIAKFAVQIIATKSFVVNLLRCIGLKLDTIEFGDTLLHGAAKRGLAKFCQVLERRAAPGCNPPQFIEGIHC